MRSAFLIVTLLAIAAVLYGAETAGTVRGVVHDPQHRPIAGAMVTLSAQSGVWAKTQKSNASGEFQFRDVPPGAYIISAAAPGFAPIKVSVTVQPGLGPVLHLWMKIRIAKQAVTVSGAPALLNEQTSTTQTLVTRKQINHTPGADLSNSMSMITDFVPGAYMVHDMLHVRGGHQESWFIDGIPDLNTNIASNVGPGIDPKNVNSLQVQTGGYSSEYGDRTYGFFNAVTPSGFNRNNEGELILSGGNFNQTDDLLSFGSHTQRLSYYASVNGNRSDLGLSTPTPTVLHDQESGLGGFGSVLFNQSPENQFRFLVSLRGNHYQIPNTPEQQVAGIRDLDVERGDLVGMTWAHSSPNGTTLTLSPFFHFNRADYIGGPGDTPFILNDNRRSSYVGALTNLTVPLGKNNFQGGLEVWGQHDNTFFGLAANPGTRVLQQDFRPWGNDEALFFGDRYQASSWLTLNGGVRLTHYGGLLSEDVADPRLGAALRIPRLHWVLHGYYSDYYQPPPLDTVTGPLLNFAVNQGFGFIPLPGERDKQWDAGLTIPWRHWFLNVDHFRTSASNFLDHDEVGNSDIFLPLTDLAALISGTEVTLRSPEIFNHGSLNIVYSNQVAEGLGPITGGLIEFAPTSYFFLDHDQRNTVNTVLQFTLPRKTWASAVYSFGSGFLNGNGPAHLPPHSTVGLALGKDFGEAWSLSLNAVNLTNARFLLDTSNTFGGTHVVDPRELYVQLTWRFHY